MEHKIKRSQEQHQWKEKIEELLKNMKYGNITIIVQDGKIIQIDKTEKHRIQQIENQSQKRIGKRSSVDYDSQKGDVIIWKT